MNLLTVLTVLPVVLRLLTSLMGIAEEMFGDGTGKFKKQWVTDAVSGFIPVMKEVSTGGQKETWSAIETGWEVMHSSIGSVIDFMAGVLFPHE